MILKKMLIDTNYFIRAITFDNKDLGEKAQKLFLEIYHKKLTGISDTMVISEIIYVLCGNTYQFSRAKARQRLIPILQLDNLIINNKSQLVLALELFENSKLDFVDCYLIAMQKTNNYELATFDKKILKQLN
jgi:predicted nucleic acid-binding protein